MRATGEAGVFVAQERNAMLVERVSRNGRVTLPAEVRRRLDLKPGSAVRFAVAGDSAVLRRLEAADAELFMLEEHAFEDWSSPDADEAFRHL